MSMMLLVMLAVMSHPLLSPTFTMPLARFTQLLSHTCTLSPLLPSQPSLTQLPLLLQPSAMLETMAMLLLPQPSQPQQSPPQPLPPQLSQLQLLLQEDTVMPAATAGLVPRALELLPLA